MIIATHRSVTARDLGKYAWSNLRNFHNISTLLKTHISLNNVPKKYHKFAAKQAEQIRYCLIQAREYAQAAEQVSLATKPLLLYYSCMSLALAEILMKQTGESSLDVARKTHNHHGLILRINENAVRESEDINLVGLSLRAEPMIRGNNERAGTFELWHRSARAMPSVGSHTVQHSDKGMASGKRVISTAEDKRYNLIPKNGLSLIDCLACVPGLADALHSHGLESRLIRGSVSQHINHSGESLFVEKSNFSITIHPTARTSFENWCDRVKFLQPRVDNIDLVDMPFGGILKVNTETMPCDEMIAPNSVNTDEDEVLYWDHEEFMNEFGYMYVGLYILGNFSRYYPDLWMKAVEQNHPVASLAERFFELVEDRMPLAALSEISRIYHVPKTR